MATDLTGTKIKDTYQQILHVDGGVTSTDKTVYDGDGTATGLKVSTTGIDATVLKLAGSAVTASATELNLLDGATGTLVNTATAQTLTNKTISADNNTLSGIAASSFVLSNASGNIDGAVAQKAIPAGVVVGTTDTQTLTNKTLTAPVINSPTGIVKADVGLGNVDNTSDATKNSATATLTNKTLTAPVVNTPNLTGGTINNATIGASTASTVASTNLSYTGTLTGGTGVVNLGSGQVYKDASGNVGIGTSSPQNKLHVSGNVTLDNFGNIGATGNDAGISFSGGSATNNGGQINLRGGSFSTANAIEFVQGGTESARIDSSGNLLVGTTSTSLVNSGVVLTKTVSENSFIDVKHNTTDAGGVGYVRFIRNGTIVGQVVSTGTTNVSYATSSDYRLKENVTPMQNALATVAQLKPCTYNWKVDGSNGQGFIAHELQAVVPDCVSGEKDAVDKDGKPQYQGVDTSFLVATLVAAIQELKAEVDTLKTQING